MGGDEKKGRKISERVFPGLRLLEDLLICARVESYSRQRDRGKKKSIHGRCVKESRILYLPW